MNLKFFIERPILSGVISVTIVLMGLIALFTLPVELYPDIAPPTVNVMATYPGANAETVQKAVIIPLEEAINGVEGMTYITSTASNTGDASITIYFRAKTNADMAAVNVQNRVSKSLSMLPAEVTKTGVSVEKQQNSELKTFALYSKDNRYDRQFLNNYMVLNVEQRLKRIGGVGNVMQYGSRYSMRIWMKPDKMAQFKLIPSDITAVLAKQNIEASTGSFGENHDNAYQYSMKYRGRLSTAEEFENLVVRSLPNGEVLRLREVANIELGDEAYNYTTELNGRPCAMALIYQTPGSNAAQTNKEIDKVLAEVSKELPKGLEFVTMNDTNRFLYASIHEVAKTLLEAILLVILVVYVFLQDIRSTLIPSISIIVSIIGTFAVMYLLGFSINLLTLFALVLAIGTVVDDAIVVVEAVQAKFDAGYRSPFLASKDAMRGVSSAILTSTILFMAVFIPVSMMGGTSGEFYKQFGLTMAIAVGISAVNAFTLSPALCAIWLQPYTNEDGTVKTNFAARFRNAFNAVFEIMVKRYSSGVLFFFRHKKIMWATLVTSMVLLVVLMRTTKTGLIPDEDSCSAMVSMNARPGTSMSQNQKLMKELDKNLDKIKEIKYRADVAGYSFSGAGPSMGMSFLSLRPWGERTEEGQSINEVIDRINALGQSNPDLTLMAMPSPLLQGFGMGSGFELMLQDKQSGDIQKFKKVADQLVEALSKRAEIGTVYSSFKTDYPQYWVDVDAAQCEKAGIATTDVLETLSGYFTSGYISDFNRFSKRYSVMMQADPSYLVTQESLNHLYVRVGQEMAPLSTFVKLTKTYGPSDLSRFNLFNSISISGTNADGYSSGEALNAIKEVAANTLPPDYGYEFGGISREEVTTNNNSTIIFGICLLLIYLLLCALYESLIIPFAVIFSVPCGLFGSFLFTNLFGLENNIYMQTGLIMLIGLLSKTAILLTEYASECRKSGMPLAKAALKAAQVRLRPILMTVLTMVFGMIPLMLSNGVGANGNRSLATGTIGGMIIGTLALLFFVPSLFIVFQFIQERFYHKGKMYNK